MCLCESEINLTESK